MQDHREQLSDQHPSPKRRAGAVLAGALCVTAAVAVWALISGSFDATSWRVLASALAAALATLSGLAGAAVPARHDHRHALGQATIAVSGVALALAVGLIWVPAALDTDIVARAFAISLATMIAGAHASLVYSRLRPRDGREIVALTEIGVASSFGAALLISDLLVFVPGGVHPTEWRLLGVLVVVAVFTTLLAALARRFGPGPSTREASGTTPPPPPQPTAHAGRSTDTRAVLVSPRPGA